MNKTSEFKHPNKESLDLIREKSLQKDVKLSSAERLALDEVYHDITGRFINKGCTNGCIEQAMKIVSNYIKYHEPKGDKATKVKKIQNDEPEDELMQFKLKELREMYPEIKATSKEDFIKQVRQDD